MSKSEETTGPHFIEKIIDADLAAGKNGGKVHTRFPPEPNGYLHIGHAKSICLNFGLAKKYGGPCNLRFDDTNPTTEDVEYVQSIQDDIRWLGFDWEDRIFFASDYFDQLYQWAIKLIELGKAYVDHSTLEEVREQRGTLTEPGVNGPHRDRSAEENLSLFEKMKAGELEEGECVLRAKIDMAHPNLNMRDPTIYRIRKATHHRTGDKWCIYPMYDWAHGQSDSIEGITHSICTLEFENHRPLYNWCLEQLGIHHPQQIEFARLNLSHTIMSKRKLLELVEAKQVSGWDDPRMPTLSGLRRRGYTPKSIRDFCELVGVAKADALIEMALLEHCLRNDLNQHSSRVMGVLNPLKVVIENWPAGKVDEIDAVNNPEDPDAGTRKVPFAGELWIERDDFMEDPPKKFFRLAPGREVRLRYGYFITCTDVIKDDAGQVTELRCSYDPDSRGGSSPDGRKVKATLHWVSAAHAIPAEVRLYDTLLSNPTPGSSGDHADDLNPDSLEILQDCQIEPSLAAAREGDRFQFERMGYFCVDSDTGQNGKLVFNRTVGLRDSWAKIQKQKN
ncbi:MAG: glutamine--tRNA ligase/YqeY domain fusion protein [Planctomycetota bacterium]|nr:glutamine--tRNA ligase/YqeY domain fusion protein [Planctomycetota bacterium]